MPPNAVVCLCGNLIGYELEKDGIAFLQIGGLVADSVHGFCAQCGRGFHHTIALQAYKRLMRRYETDDVEPLAVEIESPAEK